MIDIQINCNGNYCTSVYKDGNLFVYKGECVSKGRGDGAGNILYHMNGEVARKGYGYGDGTADGSGSGTGTSENYAEDEEE